MWRPVYYAKRTHGIGLGGMHSTGRLPSSTVPPPESSTNRPSFESELAKRQHKLAHARQIRSAIRAKLKKEQLDTSPNCFQHNPSPAKDDMLAGASRKRWATESNHQHGGGQCRKRLKRDKASCRRDRCTTDEESESESDMTSSHSENTDGSVLSSDELDDEEDDDTLTEEDTKSDSLAENDEVDEVDEEDDRILAAEEEALHRLSSKASSQLRCDKRLLKKQQRSTRHKSTEDQHRGCGLVATPHEEDPLGEGRRRRRRRYRRRYRRQYPIQRTYRRSRRRRRPRCSLTPRRRYRRRYY